MRNVSIVGNTGGQAQALDGQTVRTRLVISEFRARLGADRVHSVDTSLLGRKPLSVIREIFWGFRETDVVAVMPGIRGLFAFLPLFLLLQKYFGRPVHYFVVGGWLIDVAGRYGWIRWALSRLSALHVQSTSMARALSGMGLSNVRYLPNFRNFRRAEARPVPPSTPCAFVFLSRVIPEKGVGLCIDAVQWLNDESGRVVATLDIWGPIPQIYTRWFRQAIGSGDGSIRYRGVVDSSEVCEVLSNYDILLFPTWYDGEGFPGVMVEAFAAGLAVVASDWKYNSEVVQDGVNGVIIHTGNIDELRQKLSWLSRDSQTVERMKTAALASADRYHVDAVIPSLLADMGLIPDGPVQATER